jgi:hypothetical protein
MLVGITGMVEVQFLQWPPFAQPLLYSAAGILFGFLWLRAVHSLIQAWSDPSARVLRFSASVLLVFVAGATYQLFLGAWA